MQTLCGTPAYLSPEQLDGKLTQGYTKVCSQRSLIYGIFCALPGSFICVVRHLTPISEVLVCAHLVITRSSLLYLRFTSLAFHLFALLAPSHWCLVSVVNHVFSPRMCPFASV